MTFPKARLVVSACLFFGWLAFLLFLVIDSNPVILSKPQFLIAQLYIVAQVHDKDGGADALVKVNEVLWSADAKDAALAGRALRIAGLAGVDRQAGYAGPGAYLLALQRTMAGTYRLAPLPPTAGVAERRIYPWNAATKEQVRAIIASRQ